MVYMQKYTDELSRLCVKHPLPPVAPLSIVSFIVQCTISNTYITIYYMLWLWNSKQLITNHIRTNSVKSINKHEQSFTTPKVQYTYYLLRAPFITNVFPLSVPTTIIFHWSVLHITCTLNKICYFNTCLIKTTIQVNCR